MESQGEKRGSARWEECVPPPCPGPDPDPDKRCGPDVTDFLVSAIIDAWQNHPSTGTTTERLTDFYYLEHRHGLYDFKSYLPFVSRNCPTDECANTVTLCHRCLGKETVGNVFYGMFGSVSSIHTQMLLRGADLFQQDGADEPWDAAAIRAGIETMRETVWNPEFRFAHNNDTPEQLHAAIATELCNQIGKQGQTLIDPTFTEKASECSPCKESYSIDFRKYFEQVRKK